MIRIPPIDGLETREVRNISELVTARRLHARCYVEAGYTKLDDLDECGLISDPWVDYSDYFVAIDTERSEIVGTCRIIRPSVQGFPLFRYFDLSDEALAVFRDLDPKLCGEVSSLATTRQGLQNTAISAALYGVVWREFLVRRYAYMLAVMDSQLLRIMRRWLHFPFEDLGPSSYFMGDQTTPVAMFVPRNIEHLQERSPDSLRFFSGEISFAEMDEIAIDLRSTAPEFSTRFTNAEGMTLLS